jgi:polar amino acid transport system substrate-binding protein
MTTWRRTIGALALAAAFAAGALTGAAQAQQQNLIEAIKKRGKMQVAFGTFLPWAVRDKQGGWIGFEIDVSTKLAKDMGVEIELLPTAWDGIIPGLIAGRYDVIIGGMSITAARKEQVDFTAPYSNSGLGVTASKTVAANLKWPEGYNDAAVTFTCRRGVVGCKVIEERWPKATLRQFDDEAVSFQEVIDGKAHATVSSEPKPRFYTIQNPEKLFQPTTEYLTTSEEGMAVKKGNPEALAFFNDWIAKNQAFLKERHAYWFRTRDWVDRIATN